MVGFFRHQDQDIGCPNHRYLLFKNIYCKSVVNNDKMQIWVLFKTECSLIFPLSFLFFIIFLMFIHVCLVIHAVLHNLSLIKMMCDIALICQLFYYSMHAHSVIRYS